MVASAVVYMYTNKILDDYCSWVWSNLCPLPSAAAKKAACPHPGGSGEKGEGQEKEVLNGELEEERNGKVKEGEGAATCGSKLRACRRTGGESSDAGMELKLRNNKNFKVLVQANFNFETSFLSCKNDLDF